MKVRVAKLSVFVALTLGLGCSLMACTQAPVGQKLGGTVAPQTNSPRPSQHDDLAAPTVPTTSSASPDANVPTNETDADPVVQGCQILQRDFSSSGIAAAMPLIEKGASTDDRWQRAAVDLRFLSGFDDRTPATDERVDRAAQVAEDCTTIAKVLVSTD